MRLSTPVPMQPLRRLASSWYVMVVDEEKGQVVVAVAVPVIDGIGFTLQEIVNAGGQVIET